MSVCSVRSCTWFSSSSRLHSRCSTSIVFVKNFGFLHSHCFEDKNHIWISIITHTWLRPFHACHSSIHVAHYKWCIHETLFYFKNYQKFLRINGRYWKLFRNRYYMVICVSVEKGIIKLWWIYFFKYLSVSELLHRHAYCSMTYWIRMYAAFCHSFCFANILRLHGVCHL